ncbi:MAG: EAL domain-containing protein [Minwuia sp.]|uniref:EAL domain-containing protein n=1 Tax=Minwuia sp. TaxID=2493630 RepID=UPI003A890C3C
MNERLTEDFRMALERQELSPAFQPICELGAGRLAGAEALMRWRHPVHGAVGPDTFIPLSERDGSLDAPGVWMVEQALTALSDWRDRGREELFVAVNLSPAQLLSDDFTGACEFLLAESGLEREALHLEITETSPVALDKAVDQIEALHRAGFHLSIDDFGTGFSSLAYVHKLPFRTIKIDRSFVRDLPDVREARVIVASVVRLAHELGMTVVAEGVETEGQRAFLDGEGCDLAQGFFYGLPMSAADFGTRI